METPAHLHPSPLPIGTRIGVYQLQKVLAANWFGPLYLAWNHHLGTHVIVEEYLPRPLSLRAEDGVNVLPESPAHEADFHYGVERFLEESEMLIGIEHPNVVRTDSVLHANGTLYRVMEHIAGRALTSVCGDQDAAIIEEHDFYSLALQLLEGLIPVHEKGYAHGALRPACIVQKADGTAVLQGFSWSQLALSARLQTLPEGLHDGYAAAEQYHASGPPQAYSDVYALGATLYRCLAQRDPIPAQQRIAARQSEGFDPQPKASLEPSLMHYAPALLRTIDSMLALEGANRPQTAGIVHDALKQVALSVPGDRMAKRTDTTPSESREHSTSRVRSSARWLLAGGLVIAGLATVTLSLRTSEKTQPTSVASTESPPAHPERPSDEKIRQSKPPEAVPTNQGLSPEASPATAAAKNNGMTTLSADAAARTAGVDQSVPEPGETKTKEKTEPSAGLRDSSTAPMTVVPPPHPSPSPAPKTPSAPSATSSSEANDTASVPAPDGVDQTPSVTEADRDQQAIERHLAAAEAHLTTLQLTTPSGDNAYEHLQAVEALAPDHPKIREGFEAIVTRYGWLIEKALAEGQLRRARIYLKRAEQVSPAEPLLKELRQALRQAEVYPPRESSVR